MDDLIALMEEDESGLDEPSLETADKAMKHHSIAKESVVRQPPKPSRPHSREHAVDKPVRPADSTIDDKVGIRMVQRNLSGVDLVELITTHPYHSPAALCAMSRASLNQLLLDPASIVNEATVQGKMGIVTLGIVFTNSGTRVSSNGRAFSILTIGNLSTGPTATVFLFGDAYSRHSSKCSAGKVVALLGPSLVPSRPEKSSKTDIALSAREQRQLIVVANARDYGTCKATTRIRRPDGNWTNGGRCKNFVDTRCGEFCLHHRKQANARNTTSSSRPKLQTGLDKLRRLHEESKIVPSLRDARPSGVLTIRTSTGTVVAHIPKDLQKQQPVVVNGALKAPKHMKKMVPAPNRQPVNRRQANRSQAKGRDWLVGKENRGSKPKRKINTDGTNFDGNVYIPKPNKLFASARKPNQPLHTASSLDQHAAEAKKQSILERQKNLANVLSTKRSERGIHVDRRPARAALDATKQVGDKSGTDSLFGKFSGVTVEEMMQAKSKFAEEADAEEFARKRQKVFDLERREESKTARDNKANALQSDRSIKKLWRCATCNISSAVRPSMCLRAGHKVTLRRNIETARTKMEKRTKLNNKKVEDGGLVLGAGLEWSWRNRCSA